MAITSLVLGILSIVFSVFSMRLIGWLGTILGVIGIIFGVLAKKKETEDNPSKVGKAGLICSIIGTALSLILYIACIACLVGAGTANGGY